MTSDPAPEPPADKKPSPLRRAFTWVHDLFVRLIGSGRSWETAKDLAKVVATVDEWQSVHSVSDHDVLVVAVPAADGTMTHEIVVQRALKSGKRRGARHAIWYEFRLRALARPGQAVATGFVSAVVTTLAVLLILAGLPLLADVVVGAVGLACGVVAALSLFAGTVTAVRGINRSGWIPGSSHSLYAPVRTDKDGRAALEEDEALRALCDALNGEGNRTVDQVLEDEAIVQRGRRTRRAPVRWVSITAALGAVGAAATFFGNLFGADSKDLAEPLFGLDPNLVIGAGALLFLVVFPVLVYLGNVAGARSRDYWNDPTWTTPSATKSQDDASS